MDNSSSCTHYDKLIGMMNQLDLEDDGIQMNHKIKSIALDFCNIVKNEDMLSQSMEYINEKALNDHFSSLKFALLFSSRCFDSLAMNELKVRSKMISILEQNYVKAKEYNLDNKSRLYNSITLLGECFHRIRTSNDTPIKILGKSLLHLLNQMIHGSDHIDYKLAKLILSQVTLNGNIMHSHHKEELDLLLFHVRRNLIEQENLTDTVKALLLMTLDLYYSNFSSLGNMLEEMYTKYLVREEPLEEVEAEVNDFANANNNNLKVTKKWSEQVGEELNENGFLMPLPPINSEEISYSHNSSFEHESNANTAATSPSSEHISPKQQWRQPRYNRDKDDFHGRRLSGNFEDDRHSVRSEGGSIRLYNVSDRLRHSQQYKNGVDNGGKWEQNGNFRNNNNRRSFIESSNSRNSSRNNLNNIGDNGNNFKRSNFNNQRTFERPPRFRNNQKDNDQPWRNNNRRDSFRGYSETREKEGEVDHPSNSRSSSRNRTLPRNNKTRFQENNGTASGRRSVSPSTYSENNYNTHSYQKRDYQQHRPQQSRNFSGSHNHNQQNQRSHNNRYSSQSSLASDYGSGGSNWDHRRNNNRRDFIPGGNRGGSNQHLKQQPHSDNSWEESSKDNSSNANDELVRNARETSKYIEFLSQQ